jgi:hypothetical protein
VNWWDYFRPFAWGATWDAMTPAERRRAVLADFILAGTVAGLLLACGWWFE